MGLGKKDWGGLRGPSDGNAGRTDAGEPVGRFSRGPCCLVLLDLCPASDEISAPPPKGLRLALAALSRLAERRRNQEKRDDRGAPRCSGGMVVVVVGGGLRLHWGVVY